MSIFVVRHAKAGSRQRWDGDDTVRPLTEDGWRQAEALAARLAGEAISGLWSSPYVRCMQTLEPLGRTLGMPVVAEDRLREGTRFEAVLALLAELPDGAVLCSHGDVIPELIRRAQLRGMHVPGKSGAAKGSVWTLEHWDGERFATGVYTPIPG